MVIQVILDFVEAYTQIWLHLDLHKNDHKI